MTGEYISTLHIHKLGHEIQEIRERALLNITSKLSNGWVFDNNLARTKEILSKLFEWFLLEPCTKHELVFDLITRVLKSHSGKLLLNHEGTVRIKTELKQLFSYLEPKHHRSLVEILKILEESPVVPLLQLETGSSVNLERPVGTTATTIEGFIHEDSSASQKAGQNRRKEVQDDLKWQFLIEPDRHVLQSIENLLKNPPQPASLLQSADFFINILLHDFPAETFLQRPGIVLTFLDLLESCPSTRVINAVLHCFIKLTKALQIRINYNNDPCLLGSRVCLSRASTPDSSRKTASGRSGSHPEEEDCVLLKNQQVSCSQYCFMSLKAIFQFLSVKPGGFQRKDNQEGVNLSWILLDELVKLIDMILDENWLESECRGDIQSVLLGYGTLIEYFRIEAMSDDRNVIIRANQLCLLHNCSDFLTKIVPLNQTGLILPRNLKVSLANSLIDVALKMYPSLYEKIFSYVESFKTGLDSEILQKFEKTDKICKSITAAVEFFQKQGLTTNEKLDLAINALPSLEFHQDPNFLHSILQLSREKLPLNLHNEPLLDKFEILILKLLSHNLNCVKEEMYRLSHIEVMSGIGPQHYANCASVIFLLRPKILIEITCHGLTSDSQQIRSHAQDIFIYILKSKVLVSEDVWNRVLIALMAALPLLLCFISKTTSLGRCILDILDPDTARSLHLPKTHVIRGNIGCLFHEDLTVRDEAFSRLCWLLSEQDSSRDLRLKLSSLQDTALINLCQNARVFDVNKTRPVQHFYQASSLRQVLVLLQSPKVEPVIRRSALTQASVMIDDPLLHSTFLESNGLDIVLAILKSALNEKNFTDYPDSVIPVISIIKNIVLYQPSVRLKLNEDPEVFLNIVRGLYVFCAEEKLRHDAIHTLFVLVFSDFIKGSPANGNFSVPVLLKMMKLPFICRFQGDKSENMWPSLLPLLRSDRWCLSTVQIHWNLEVFGLETLLDTGPKYKDGTVNHKLQLNDYDLENLRAANLKFNIKKLLREIQNGTHHEVVIKTIHKLITYVLLSQSEILNYDWKATFTRFFKTLPSSEDDVNLLNTILAFLRILIPFYKSVDSFWLSDLLKSPATPIVDLIVLDSSALEEFKKLSYNLLEVITLCAAQEHHFIENLTLGTKKTSKSWINIIELIATTLNFNDNPHFYNLAYVDALLRCLVHLTANLGWTQTNEHFEKIIKRLVKNLCELIVVFQCGKGSTVTVSVMGLSITRNAILTLNHLVSELQNSKIRNWEQYFMDLEEEEWIKSIMVLWTSRDVLIRAGSVQFFAGLAKSQVLALHIVNVLKNVQNIWQAVFTVMTDQNEASLMKENATGLAIQCLQNTKAQSEVSSIQSLLEIHNFFHHLSVILPNLLISGAPIGDMSVVTPSLVRNYGFLLSKLIERDPEWILLQLHEFGLVKLFLRCVYNPGMDINNTRDLSLYCEILDMDSVLVGLLTQVAEVNSTSLGTILHTKDCLMVVISLLDCTIYHTSFPQLVYLRNRLWCNVFQLIAVLSSSSEALGLLSEAIEDSGKKEFLDALCEATKSLDFLALQSCALHCLSSLLTSVNSSSLQDLLDTTRTSSSSVLSTPRTRRSDTEILQDVFFKISVNSSPKQPPESPIAGAQLCKILMNLYELSHLNPSSIGRKKSVITTSLSAILSISMEAKQFAVQAGLLSIILKQFKDNYVKLNLESVDAFRRTAEKKRIHPILVELQDLVGLTTNFMVGEDEIKKEFARVGLSDVVHKLWVWFLLQKQSLIEVLRMLATFTSSKEACQSLVLTSVVAGTAPRKTPTKICLLHALVELIEKEMELVSRTHELALLHLSFVILGNSCGVFDCRVLLVKSTLLSNMGRLHPAITKKQKPWTQVELFWLEFLEDFSSYPEGQACIAKLEEVFELILALINASRDDNKRAAWVVLRNITFYQSNRARLLTSNDYLSLLRKRLMSGNKDERIMIASMLWTLSANNQKAKVIFKGLKLDVELEKILKQHLLLGFNDQDLELVRYVLSILRDL